MVVFVLWEKNGKWAVGELNKPTPQPFYTQKAPLYGVNPDLEPTKASANHEELQQHNRWRDLPPVAPKIEIAS